MKKFPLVSPILLGVIALVFVKTEARADDYTEWLKVAEAKYADGDYNAALDLCEAVAQRAPAQVPTFEEVRTKSAKQLARLANEAYVYGNLLEGMNLIPQAQQYWMRARTYVRPGDGLYDNVQSRLEKY